MITWEKSQFDEALRKRFSEGELAPVESAWLAIDLELTRADQRVARRRILFYQRLSAALAACLILGVGFWYETRQDNDNSPIADRTGQIPAAGLGTEMQAEQLPHTTEEVAAPVEKDPQHEMPAVNTEPPIVKGRSEPTESLRHTHGELIAKEWVMDDEVHISRKLEPLEIIRILPAISGAFMDDSKKTHASSGMWASLGFAGGGYSPVSGSNNQATTAVANDPLGIRQNKAASVGSAYSFGLQAGQRVTRHLVLQGGVTYLTQNLDYTSYSAALNPAVNTQDTYNSAFSGSSNGVTLQATLPYQVNTAIEMVSIPVQAGYLLLDKRIMLQLNTGLSSDFFVRSTLKDSRGQFGAVTQRSGSESGIRSINWSGLFSTDLGYRVREHYSISLVPGMRYSLNPMSKSGNAVGNSFIWDLGFRFKYHFK